MVCSSGMKANITGISWFLQGFYLFAGWLGFKKVLTIDKLKKMGFLGSYVGEWVPLILGC